MDKVKTLGLPEVDEISETQIADAVALFNRALEESEHNLAAAERLFEESFDGMLELARSGDTTAQYNVALMYGMGINEPYDDDIDLLMEWVQENREELQEYFRYIDKRIEDLEVIVDNSGEHSQTSGSVGHLDHDKEVKKLNRLYLLKARLERQGFSTGSNRDEYSDPDLD